MRRLMKALQIYLSTTFSWTTAWRHAGDSTPPTIDAPYGVVTEREDGFEYVEITPRPQ
jgi:hypothetical protein